MSHPATINRSVVMVIPKQAYYNWANTVFPDDPIKTDSFNEHNAYLLNDELLFDEPKKALKNYWEFIFENELFGICTDDSTWPQKLTWQLFTEWFTCHFSSVVLDLENKPLYLEKFD